MIIKIQFLILLSATLICGIAWALVFLLFSIFHGMTKMFNKEFIFFIAKILGVNLNTIWAGLTFAFLDGALVGFMFGLILMMIYKSSRTQS